MRWAAARVNISPLALPSPEHELTDPMRGAIAVIPGSYSPEMPPTQGPLSPGGRKSRLGSFWEGTQDVDNGPPASASPSPPSIIHSSPSQLHAALNAALPNAPTPTAAPPTVPQGVPPATAPVQHSVEQLDDYFGDAPLAPASSSHPSPEQPHPIHAGTSHVHRQSTAPPFDSTVQTVPALPRRVCLTRQTSSPLPNAQPVFDSRPGTQRSVPDALASLKAGRAVKEESMFTELGYLTAPHPPDELERRRALYQFNLRNTGADVNFDRIERLTKLVFNTKTVAISLIDGSEQ